MSEYSLPVLRGRGAQINTHNRFDAHSSSVDPNVFNDEDFEVKTQFTEVFPKTIVNKVDSPDVPMGYSMNPYQGCEHGCVYCYARNSHNYWGYSAGLEFETQILVKKNAPELLRKKLRSKSWKGTPIMLSGNTDCYQPCEKKYGITRRCLQVFLEMGHPVGLITKNHMITRDLDIIEALHKHNLVHVAISINTIEDSVRQFLEPRTSTIAKRLYAVKKLSDRGIPVVVLAAPIVPGLTDHSILPLAKACAEAGARSINHIIVRLNGDIAQIFEDWVQRAFPDRAAKILNQIKALHGGTLNDSQWGRRMRGEGPYAKIIAEQFKVARQKYFPDPPVFEFNRSLYQQLKKPQLSLF